jgi:hypothetical protein
MLPEAQIQHYNISQNMCGIRKLIKDIDASSRQYLTTLCAIFRD